MNGSPYLRRRRLLGAVALGPISVWSSVSRAASRTANIRQQKRNKLTSLLHEPGRARRIGMVYLQSPSARYAPPLALVDAVLTEMGPDAGNEAIRGYIAARIRRELRDAQVISLDGWIMSPTEAQLCGLAAGGTS